MIEFTCKLFSQSENSIRIEHNGKRVNIGRKVLEKMQTDGKGTAVIKIPEWLYDKEFES